MAGFIDKLQNIWNPPDDEYEEYEDEVIEEAPRSRRSSWGSDDEQDAGRRSASDRQSSFSSFGSRGRFDDTSSNKIVNINAKAQLQVVLYRPVSFGEETRVIADELLSRHTVVLNLEHTDSDVQRRIVDFLSGVAYANNGKIKRIASSTFIITPYNVDLTGDQVLDELEHSGLYF